MDNKISLLFVGILLVGFTSYLISSSSGKTGVTTSGCTCHGSLSEGNSAITLNATPDIFTDGYVSGETYTLAITVTGGPVGSKGGFNLKVSAGTLSNPGNNAKIQSGEATHSNSNARNWNVGWVAPGADVESVTFNFTGNAVNGNFGTSGDDPTPTAEKTAQKSGTNVAMNKSNIPEQFTVYQNYPNPFNSSTMIRYQIDDADNVLIRIYNLSGEMVFEAQQNHSQAGQFRFEWDGSDFNGQDVPSGIYVYQVKFQDSYQTKKCILIK